MIVGTPEAIRAINDGMVGHIEAGKASPDSTVSRYWDNRTGETAVRGLRFRAGGAK